MNRTDDRLEKQQKRPREIMDEPRMSGMGCQITGGQSVGKEANPRGKMR